MGRLFVLLLAAMALGSQAQTLATPHADSARVLTPQAVAARIRGILALRPAYKTVQHYTQDPLSQSIALRCDYAQAALMNAEDWDTARIDRQVHEIDMVYTQYPKDTLNWLTPYNQLMTARLQHLFGREPRLADEKIKWNLVAQTGPRNAIQAKDYFHGFVIHYRVQLSLVKQPTLRQMQEYNMDFTRRILQTGRYPDSTITTIIRRNPGWKNMLLVLDWTGSMYPYGAQLLHLHRTMQQRGLLRHMVLFNDGDDFLYDHPARRKPIGKTGGVYACDPNNLSEVVATLEEAMYSGDGTEPIENNCEAILYALRQHPGPEPVLMVADNSSRVRDMALLPQITRPVHIILCGLRPGRKTNPDLLLIAWHTGGSLHSTGQSHSFGQPRAPLPPEGLLFEGRQYVLREGKFVAL